MKAARILLVDDEEEILRLVARRLTRRGHQVTTASDSSQALARLREGPFDLAILDFTMPVMNGLELAGRCRARYPALKILMLTGSPVIEEIEIARYPFLRKPLENLQDLDQAIERLLAVDGERAGEGDG
jgi:CheY-like chemotaxis protein